MTTVANDRTMGKAKSYWVYLTQLDKQLQKNVKSEKYLTPRKIQNEKSLIKWQNQKLIDKYNKRMDNNCHIPHLVYAFSYIIIPSKILRIPSRVYWSSANISVSQMTTDMFQLS